MLLELLLVGYMGLTPDQLTEYDVHCKVDAKGVTWCKGIVDSPECIPVPNTTNEQMCTGKTLEEQRKESQQIRRRELQREWSA